MVDHGSDACLVIGFGIGGVKTLCSCACFGKDSRTQFRQTDKTSHVCMKVRVHVCTRICVEILTCLSV